jgi:hypothetical protein
LVRNFGEVRRVAARVDPRRWVERPAERIAQEPAANVRIARAQKHGAARKATDATEEAGEPDVVVRSPVVVPPGTIEGAGEDDVAVEPRVAPPVAQDIALGRVEALVPVQGVGDAVAQGVLAGGVAQAVEIVPVPLPRRVALAADLLD